MVFGFIVSTLEATPTVLLSSFYTKEGNDGKQKARIQAIFNRLRDTAAFQHVCKRAYAASPNFNTNELRQRRGNVDGVFCIPVGKYFQQAKVVMWRQINSLAYTIICEMDENRMLAQNFLTVFPTVMNEHNKNQASAGQGSDYLIKPEEVLVLLHQYLPNGQLLVMTHAYTQHLRKEANSMLLK